MPPRKKLVRICNKKTSVSYRMYGLWAIGSSEQVFGCFLHVLTVRRLRGLLRQLWVYLHLWPIFVGGAGIVRLRRRSVALRWRKRRRFNLRRRKFSAERRYRHIGAEANRWAMVVRRENCIWLRDDDIFGWRRIVRVVMRSLLNSL